MMIKRRTALSALICAAAFGKAARAGTYPDRPVRVIVPFTAGGGTDIVARTIMLKVGEIIGANMVIENRGGAGGIVGTEVVATAAPDGYTLGLVSASHSVNPSLYKHIPYDPINSFQPISLLCSGPGVLVVNPALPVHNVKQLIAYAKAQSKPLEFASAGNGTPPHLAGELFMSMAGIHLIHVPYKGNEQAMVDVAGNRVPISFPTMPSALPYIRSGKLRALAVTSAERATALPDVPTIAESGLPGYEASSWYGLLAPAHIPAPALATLSKAAAEAVRDPVISKRLLAEGLEPVGSTPEAFAKVIRTDIAKWGALAKQTHAHLN